MYRNWETDSKILMYPLLSLLINFEGYKNCKISCKKFSGGNLKFNDFIRNGFFKNVEKIDAVLHYEDNFVSRFRDAYISLTRTCLEFGLLVNPPAHICKNEKMKHETWMRDFSLISTHLLNARFLSHLISFNSTWYNSYWE